VTVPVIGITTSCGTDPNDETRSERLYVNRLYADCIVAAGGAPILLTKQTPIAVALELIDGLLIPGGDDIDARFFGQDNHPAVKPEDPERFLFEKELLGVLPKETPVFGICYGCQAMNVLRGGDLVQHVPDKVANTQHTGGTLQQYEVLEDSRLAGVIGTTSAQGKSYHHQANDRAGEGLAVVATSADGVVEAIEDPKLPWFIGVQWHPERTPADPSSVRLFRSFVEAAAEYRQKRRA
jgi:putative glutamine amidotransferase